MTIIIAPDPDDLRPIVEEKILPESLQIVERSTVPFYLVGDVEDGIRRDRSGVLYEVGGEHFVITASHFLEDMVSQGKAYLYIDSGRDGELPIPLAHAMFHGTEQTHRDIAIVHIPRDVAEALKEKKRFINHCDVKLQDDSLTSHYALFGYPADWTFKTEETVASQGFGLLTERYGGKRSDSHFFAPGLHLPVILKDTATPLGSDSAERLPRMQGISGCGIWKIYDPADRHSITAWKPSEITLVAIENTWFPQRDYAQCTWAGAGLELIQQNYPEACQAMRLVYRKW